MSDKGGIDPGMVKWVEELNLHFEDLLVNFDHQVQSVLLDIVCAYSSLACDKKVARSSGGCNVSGIAVMYPVRGSVTFNPSGLCEDFGF